MTTQIPRTRPLPQVRFRVLVAGRANAGKTTILQRVCETTESPEIHTVNIVDGRKIRKKIERLDPTFERGQHDISDELTFTNHKGYVFHDSRGLECGGEKELQIIQDFIRDRSERGKLQDRIHVIWYCISMEDNRPSLDIALLHKICPDKNVPVIAVFTKYEVFRLEVRFSVEDKKGLDGDDVLDETGRECEKVFQEKYLKILGAEPKVVRLEGMERDDGRCNDLIMTTVDALNDEVVTLMLLAVQRGKLEFSVRYAVKRCLPIVTTPRTDNAVFAKECLRSFPLIWLFLDLEDDDDDLLLLDFDFFRFRREREEEEDEDYYKNLLTVAINFGHKVARPDSSTFLILMLIITFRHATLLFINSDIHQEQALEQAIGLYSATDLGDKVEQWLTDHPDPSESQIVQFINTHSM